MAVVYKYGGFYSDLDAVTIADLSKLRNTIGSEDWYTPSGEFHFDKHHKVMKRSMAKIPSNYTGKDRIEIGPILGI